MLACTAKVNDRRELKRHREIALLPGNHFPSLAASAPTFTCVLAVLCTVGDTYAALNLRCRFGTKLKNQPADAYPGASLHSQGKRHREIALILIRHSRVFLSGISTLHFPSGGDPRLQPSRMTIYFTAQGEIPHPVRDDMLIISLLSFILVPH